MDLYSLHNVSEACVDGLHFKEWKHFKCNSIKFYSGMKRTEKRERESESVHWGEESFVDSERK